MTSRGWCFTDFEKDGEYWYWLGKNAVGVVLAPKPIPTDIRYIIWSREKCPDTGRIHSQGYIELNSPMRMAGVKKLFKNDKIHLERRFGKREEARDYCLKEDTHVDGPYEIGDWEKGGQGARSDLIDLKRYIDTGKSERDVVDDFPEMYIKYSTGIRRVLEKKQTRRNWKTFVTVYYGKTGHGKSETAWEHFPDAYPKMATNKWWDGYDGDERVIIDDFRGAFEWEYLLTLLDKYPMLVETKGGTKQFLAKNIIITSAIHPALWYETKDGDSIAQLLRRIDEIWQFTDDGCHKEDKGNTVPLSSTVEKEEKEGREKMKNFIKIIK